MRDQGDQRISCLPHREYELIGESNFYKETVGLMRGPAVRICGQPHDIHPDRRPRTGTSAGAVNRFGDGTFYKDAIEHPVERGLLSQPAGQSRLRANGISWHAVRPTESSSKATPRRDTTTRCDASNAHERYGFSRLLPDGDFDGDG